MKRDMELVRSILLASEENASFTSREPLSVEGYSSLDLLYHVRLLDEAEYLDDNLLITMEGSIFVGGLTWKGHEFLDAARNESVWQKARDKFGGQFMSIPFAVLQQTLNEIISSSLS